MAKPSSAYARKLQDPRWQKRRLEVLEKAKWACEICGDEGRTLHVHHRLYEWGRDPWEYPEETLECLCSECHQVAGTLQKALKREIAGLNSMTLDRLIGYVRGLQNHPDYNLGGEDKKIPVDSYEQAVGLADCFDCYPNDVVSLSSADGTTTACDLDKNSRLAKKKA